LYAIVGSSGLLPVVFIIYRLLGTIPGFTERYTHGPKIKLPGWVLNLLTIILLGGMFFVGFFPNILFGILWVAPMGIMALALHKIDLWTPFRPIVTGNWAPALKYT
jgi:hypothetical protein